MTDIIVKTENGELVTNRDQLVVVDNIESLIKVIRGQQVMLDRDLATLYGVETKRLNEQVKRNTKRFRPVRLKSFRRFIAVWILDRRLYKNELVIISASHLIAFRLQTRVSGVLSCEC